MSRVTDTIGIVEIKLSRSDISSKVERHLRKKGATPMSLDFTFKDPAKFEKLLKEPWPIVVRFVP